MTRYTKEMHEEYRRQQDEKAAREETARRERAEKESAKRAWIADGGDEASFEKEWPGLRAEGRRRRVLDADQRAREEMRSSNVSRV